MLGRGYHSYLMRDNMPDVAMQLRNYAFNVRDADIKAVMREAANELDRLRAELEQLRSVAQRPAPRTSSRWTTAAIGRC